MELNGIKNLVFDLGGVLIHYRWKDMLCDYGLTPEEAERVGAEMFDNPQDLWHEFDLGNFDTEAAVAAYREAFPEDGDAIEWFIRHGEYMHVPRPRVWKLVHELKDAGWPIYLLSNYPEELFLKHTEYADFMQDLDGMVVSYKVRLGKPDPAIFRCLCEKYALTPQECLFFDDREANIEGAAAIGMAGRQVFTQEGLIEDLEKILAGEALAKRKGCGLPGRLPEK